MGWSLLLWSIPARGRVQFTTDGCGALAIQARQGASLRSARKRLNFNSSPACTPVDSALRMMKQLDLSWNSAHASPDVRWCDCQYAARIGLQDAALIFQAAGLFLSVTAQGIRTVRLGGGASPSSFARRCTN